MRAGFVPGKDLADRLSDIVFDDEVDECVVVRRCRGVTALQPFLSQPEETQVEIRPVGRRRAADDDHAVVVAYEDRGWHGVSPGVFDDDGRDSCARLQLSRWIF